LRFNKHAFDAGARMRGPTGAVVVPGWCAVVGGRALLELGEFASADRYEREPKQCPFEAG